MDNNTDNNPYSNPYTHPYQEPVQGDNKEQKPPKKKKGGWGATIGKAVVAALIFSIVAAPVFTGITYGMNKVLEASAPTSEEKEDSQNKKDDTSELKQDMTSNQSAISTTNTTNVAGDIVDVSDIVQEVMPSIVSITNTSTTAYDSYWGTKTYDTQSCGSGIIIAQDDEYIYIVSNNHVVENATKLTVQFVDDSIVDAEIKGTEASDDLAVIRVARKDIEASTLAKIKVAKVADSTTLQVGSASIAIGNALGYGQSVTTGVISALNRSVTISDNGATVIHNNLIQTDAAINPGNSGGALLNAKGEVIGINSAKYSDTSVEGIGYAIPITDAMKVVERLITREKVDEADAAYLGIQGRDITSSMATAYDWPMGVYVVEALNGKAAAQSGIKAKDIIVAVGDVTITSMSDLKNELSYHKAGESVTITVQRMDNGEFKQLEINVKLGSAAEENR